MTSPPQHHARITVQVIVPDGVYVPTETQLSDTERDQLGHDDAITLAQVATYIVERLAAIGISVPDIGVQITDAPEIETVVP